MEILRRALFVTPFAPLPLSEGHRKRMAATLAALRALGYRVDILFLALEHAWLDLFDAALFREIGDLADTLHFVRGRHPTRLETGTYGVDDWWQPEFDDYAAWVFRNVSYEVVLTNYVFTTRVFALARPGSVRVVDTHDLFADRRDLLERHGLRIEFFHTDRANEAAGLARADLVLAIKEQEAEQFRGYGCPAVLTLPYVEADQPGLPAPRAGSSTAVFGYFASRNQINVRNFVEFVDTLVAGPRLDIRAYGSICDALPEAADGRYTRAGRVETAAEFYAAVDCVIVPQHFSTGLKIKVGEALAFGRPMICHAHAFEGFGEAPHPALACPDFATMTHWMRRFVHEPALRTELADAVALVQQRQGAAVARSTAAIGAAVRDGRRNLLLLVDAAALQRDRLYRFVIECLTGVFGTGYRCVLGAAEPGAGFAEADLVGSATTAIAGSVEALADPGRCGYRFAAVFALDRPQGARPGLAAFGPVPRFVAPDLAAYLAAASGTAAPAGGEGGLILRGRHSAMASTSRALPVAWLRWSPWFFEICRDGGEYFASRQIWVLTAPGRRREASIMAASLGERLPLSPQIFCAGGPGAAGIAGAGGAYAEAFGRLNAPAGVIDLADGAPAFGLLREWLALNHVPVMSLPAEGGGPAMLGTGLRRFLAEATATAPAWRQRPPQSPGWTTAGWQSVIDAIDARG